MFMIGHDYNMLLPLGFMLLFSSLVFGGDQPYYQTAVVVFIVPKMMSENATENRFTLYGTWPCNTTMIDPSNPFSNFSYRPITNCPDPGFSVSQLSESLQTRLKDGWKTYGKGMSRTDEAFWQHEYVEHGACTLRKMSPEQYFARTIEIWEQHPIEFWFQQYSLKSDTQIDLFFFWVASKRGFGYIPWLRCDDETNSRLTQIGLCFDEDLENGKDCDKKPNNCNSRVEYSM